VISHGLDTQWKSLAEKKGAQTKNLRIDKTQPSQRISEFLDESFEVDGENIRCVACRRTYGLKRSNITDHIKSKNHVKNKQKWVEMQQQQSQKTEDLNQLNSQFRMKTLITSGLIFIYGVLVSLNPPLLKRNYYY